MPRGSGFLKLYDFEPRVFARRLVKVSVNANIFWQANISCLVIVFTYFIILTLTNSAICDIMYNVHVIILNT